MRAALTALVAFFSALAALAFLFGLVSADVASAVVADVHDTGRGAIIVTLLQRSGAV